MPRTMAELDKPDRAAEEEETAEQQPSKRRKPGRLLARLLEPKWLLVLLAVSITGHAIGFTYYKAVARGSADDPSREVSLGVFRFVADPAEGSGIGTADFALHLALLEQVEGAARRELSAKRFRVQQAVEELIRRAHGGDFEDPLLTDLKQRLQEQINEALGIRVIADVIITDLKLERKGEPIERIADTGGAEPWAAAAAGVSSRRAAR
jgi:flagellar basal body-associated protein FliL